MGHPYPGIWTFGHHPWLKPMHESKAHHNVGQKAAQTGYTEWAINMACYFLDIKGMDVLYVLPNTRPDAAAFSSGRFDAAVELSEHMRAMFTDVQNMGHKRAGPTNLYVRGSNSRSGLMSMPISLLLLDELDEMDQDNISLAKQRLKGQIERYEIDISTPTIPDYGINVPFQDSTQEYWHFRCPSCSQFITLEFPDNLVVCGEFPGDPNVNKSYLICNKCKAILPHEDKIRFLNTGESVPKYLDRTIRGFHINQLYSMHLPPSVVATDFLNSEKDPSAEQTFNNATLGRPHIVAGAQVTTEMINGCVGNYRKLTFNRYSPVTMGVDIGKRIHVEVDIWPHVQRSGFDVNTYSRCQMITHLEVDHFEQLDQLMMDFGVGFCIVDSQPEKRKAIEFANRFPGRVKLCRYPVGINGRNVTLASDEEVMVNVDRTSWLDLSLGRFKNGTITIPSDTGNDYKDQIKAQVRIPKKDQHGNPVARYETPGNRHDHYGHARNYAEIALPFALGLGTTSDIQ